MGKVKKLDFWVRRRSHIMLLLIGSVVVLVLFFNEDTSLKLNMQYEEEIRQLRSEIKVCKDSAEWYRSRREALETGNDELEHIAREEYHMQRPTEDVYVIK